MANELYPRGAGESLEEIGAQGKGKKWKNWWMRYRIHLLLVVVALILLGSLLFPLLRRAVPDYRVGLITSYTMPSEGVDQLEEVLARYADDRNGDGEVLVSVSTYNFPSSVDTQRRENILMRLEADCASNEVQVFFYEEAGFQEAQDALKGLLQYNDGTLMGEDATDFENARLSWNDYAGLASFEPQPTSDGTYTSDMLTNLYTQLWVSVRSSESRIPLNDQEQQYYHGCLDMLERLQEDAPINGNTQTEEG